jgi:hypothetical protein
MISTTTTFDDLCAHQRETPSVNVFDGIRAYRPSQFATDCAEVFFSGTDGEFSLITIGDSMSVLPTDRSMVRLDLLPMCVGSDDRCALSSKCVLLANVTSGLIQMLTPATASYLRGICAHRLRDCGFTDVQIPPFLRSAVSISGSADRGGTMRGDDVFCVLAEHGLQYMLGRSADQLIVCDLQQSQVVVITSRSHLSHLMRWYDVLTQVQPVLRSWLPSWMVPGTTTASVVSVGAAIPRVSQEFGSFLDFRAYRCYVLDYIMRRTDDAVRELLSSVSDDKISISNPFHYGYCWLLMFRSGRRAQVLRELESDGVRPSLLDADVCRAALYPDNYFVKYVRVSGDSADYHVARDDYNFSLHRGRYNIRIEPKKFLKELSVLLKATATTAVHHIFF